MATLRIFVLLFGVMIAFARRDVQFRHFDDYLNSLNDKEQALLTGENELEDGSGDDDMVQQDEHNLFTPNTPLRTGLIGSKEVACCTLGQLAGDKGYHCYVKFYAARIMLRNRNRAHNRKMAFHGQYSVPNYGAKVMRTFEQCVASRSQVFHKCCQLAAIERKSRPHFDSWQRRKYEQKRRQQKRQRLSDQLLNERGYF